MVPESSALDKVHAVILNPTGGGGRAAARWRAILGSPMGRSLGLHEARVYDGRPERVPGFLQEAFSQGARHFVAAGGDGTVHGVLNSWVKVVSEGGLDPKTAQLGAIGIGSSNDFHKPNDQDGRLSIAGSPVRLAFSKAFAHDLGWVKLNGDEGNSFYFGINASIGVTAEANARFNAGGSTLKFLKRTSTDAAILYAALSTLIGYKNRVLRLSSNGSQGRELAVTNLGIIKNRHFSGSFRYDFGPQANDGKLGFLCCEGMGKPRMIRTLAALAQGRFSGLPGTEACLIEGIRVESTDLKTFAVETDGEVRQATQAEFRIAPRSIVLCP